MSKQDDQNPWPNEIEHGGAGFLGLALILAVPVFALLILTDTNDEHMAAQLGYNHASYDGLGHIPKYRQPYKETRSDTRSLDAGPDGDTNNTTENDPKKFLGDVAKLSVESGITTPGVPPEIQVQFENLLAIKEGTLGYNGNSEFTKDLIQKCVSTAFDQVAFLYGGERKIGESLYFNNDDKVNLVSTFKDCVNEQGGGNESAKAEASELIGTSATSLGLRTP